MLPENVEHSVINLWFAPSSYTKGTSNRRGWALAAVRNYFQDFGLNCSFFVRLCGVCSHFGIECTVQHQLYSFRAYQEFEGMHFYWSNNSPYIPNRKANSNIWFYFVHYQITPLKKGNFTIRLPRKTLTKPLTSAHYSTSCFKPFLFCVLLGIPQCQNDP